ncbi:MAG: purine-nucleoside phosphorylase [Actinomycetota bacterium]|nr:purine-nucleoside phosphorylase [Actinomycetota bacterium]
MTSTTDPAIDPFGTARAAAQQVAELTGVDRHDVAVVLGSGWMDAADVMGDVEAEFAVVDLIGFPEPSVAGHGATVRSIATGSNHVLAFMGRVHLYEGHTPASVVHAVRTAILAGCRVVVLTNAAGAISERFRVGQPVLVSDHLNLTGRSPLTGPAPPPPHESRFVDMTAAYSPRLRVLAREAEPSLDDGVYAGFPGPQYETPAEIRMVQRLGADLVGMSTVLETIAARHLGAEVLACSLVTNMAAGLSADNLEHADVLDVARQSAGRMGDLLANLVAEI